MQGICHSLKPGEHLKDRLKSEGILDNKTLDAIFSGRELEKNAQHHYWKNFMTKGKLLTKARQRKFTKSQVRVIIIWVEYKDDLTAFNAQKRGNLKVKASSIARSLL